jgi:hypothetical protein
MHICAWCQQKIEIESRSGILRGEPATTFGICPDCLTARLAPICPALEKREIHRARRMRRRGQSLAHIGQVLGVSQPVLRIALSDT